MEHKNIEKGNIHIIHNFEFANITERDGYTPTMEDLNKVCLVLDPYGFFALKSIEPTDWRGLSSITIDLTDFSVYSKEQTDELLNLKSDSYDIGVTEYKCGYKRGGKEVYGIEIDFGALPNATAKGVKIPNYNSNNTYWVDTSKSYAENTQYKYTLPRIEPKSISYGIDIFIDKTSGTVVINSKINYSTYNAKIVLNYTKG